MSLCISVQSRQARACRIGNRWPQKYNVIYCGGHFLLAFFSLAFHSIQSSKKTNSAAVALTFNAFWIFRKIHCVRHAHYHSPPRKPSKIRLRNNRWDSTTVINDEHEVVHLEWMIARQTNWFLDMTLHERDSCRMQIVNAYAEIISDGERKMKQVSVQHHLWRVPTYKYTAHTARCARTRCMSHISRAVWS